MLDYKDVHIGGCYWLLLADENSYCIPNYRYFLFLVTEMDVEKVKLRRINSQPIRMFEVDMRVITSANLLNSTLIQCNAVSSRCATDGEVIAALLAENKQRLEHHHKLSEALKIQAEMIEQNLAAISALQID
jgi:hypothetical protein